MPWQTAQFFAYTRAPAARLASSAVIGAALGISLRIRACNAAFANACSKTIGGAEVATGAMPSRKYPNTQIASTATVTKAPARKLPITDHRMERLREHRDRGTFRS